MFRTPNRLRSHYDVDIIVGGGHGLACAYHLASDYGITDVEVLEKSHIGSGGTGRNTAIVQSNYLTKEGAHVAIMDRKEAVRRGHLDNSPEHHVAENHARHNQADSQ